MVRDMIRWKRAAALGLLSWAIPFAISFLLFPLKKSNAQLFQTLMALIVLLTAGALLKVYFRNRSVALSEAVLVGALWWVTNLLLDYPMFFYGPMQMTASAYYSEIGLTYLTFPAFAFGAAWSPVVFIRHVGPYNEVGAAWGRLMAWAGMRGLLGPGMKLIGIAYDDPGISPSDKIRYDAAVTVSRPVQPEGDFGVTEIAGGRYAVVLHKGAYEELGQVYPAIFGGWLPENGHTLRDAPAFEQYLNSPQNTRPEDLATLIHIPLED
jgi:DNA gyrase inhibitor GyrI